MEPSSRKNCKGKERQGSTREKVGKALNWEHEPQNLDHIRNVLENKYTIADLREKERQLKAKFLATEEEVKRDTKKFKFKSAHEAAIYELSKALWGNPEEEEGEKIKKLEKNNVEDESHARWIERRLRENHKEQVKMRSQEVAILCEREAQNEVLRQIWSWF